MNYSFSSVFPNQLFTKHEKPCISIYMPTRPLIFDRKKDRLVFKNLVKEVGHSLELTYDHPDIVHLLSQIKALEYDVDLWNQTKNGLVLFADVNHIVIYLIESEVKPLAIVSTSFHIKPLFEYYQSIETFNVLALDSDAFAVYEGNLHHIESVQLSSDVKTSSKEVLGSDHTESYQTHGVYGGAQDGSTFHGHGGKSDDLELDRMKFFRYVDRHVLEHVSKNLKHPLILLAQKSNQSDFKKISNNPYLIETCIDGTIKDINEQDLKGFLKVINDSRFDMMMASVIDQYNIGLNRDLSSEQLIIILKALLMGKVDTLMIEKNKRIPGRIDHEKSQIIPSELSDPDTDDLLDDMIEYALTTGTQIYILDKDKMPSTSGVAAIFRYK
ncbi:MAG: hypothetical protein K9K93_03485 [Acholeplasmataceae bacterium]|nr:hypothetical protein [Acholeplasmataceae bacterium]